MKTRYLSQPNPPLTLRYVLVSIGLGLCAAGAIVGALLLAILRGHGL